ncbi:hypothetical protein E4T56_gene2703 [Termitomyces sp. T112]|nr:hypothetical protein E4T56_gene2703 [Termitomyces sp. T112]
MISHQNPAPLPLITQPPHPSPPQIPCTAFCLNPAKTVSFPHNPTSPDLPGSVWITSPQLPARATMARNVFECSVTSARGSRPPKQGWDRKWVAMQLEEGRRGRVSGRGSGVEGGVGVGRPPMKIGPLQGRQREGAPVTCNKGKWRASPLPEVGPSKRAQGELVMVGPPSPTVYSPTSETLVEPSVGGSWSIIEAFLWCQAEELERLLAAHGEEVHRVGEERDGF